tara:strand:- start:1184 stop:1801 length:618 start_codon:yes stop_codon:yes gene_type:complete
MSGDKRIYITVDSSEIDLLKEEIRDYIIQQVESILAEKNIIQEGEKRREELGRMVKNTFKNGTQLEELPTGNTDRNNSTTKKIEMKIKDIEEAQMAGKWVNLVEVEVLMVGEYVEESSAWEKISQYGKMKDLSDGYEFDFVIWRKSGLKDLERGKEYRLRDIVSSIYKPHPSTTLGGISEEMFEMQLNSKSEVYENQMMDEMDLL